LENVWAKTGHDVRAGKLLECIGDTGDEDAGGTTDAAVLKHIAPGSFFSLFDLDDVLDVFHLLLQLRIILVHAT
jgi:hypothetical protein